jgi:hypothetical protein
MLLKRVYNQTTIEVSKNRWKKRMNSCYILPRMGVGILILFAFLLANPSGLYSQSLLGDDPVEVDVFHPSIGATFSAQPACNFRDLQGSYGVRSMGAHVTLPLYETVQGEKTDRSYSVILLRAAASTILPEISFLDRQHTLYTSSVGLTYGILTSSRTVYTFTLNGGIAEDNETIPNSRVRVTGSGLISSRVLDQMSLLYGLAYTYTFEKGRFLPLLGLRWHFAEDWNLRAVLPMSLRFNYRYTNDVKFGVGVNVHGNRFRFSDDQLAGGETGVLNLRLTEIQMSVNVDWKLKNDISAKIEAGITAARKLYIAMDDRTLLSSSVKPSPSILMALRFTLGENKFSGEED